MDFKIDRIIRDYLALRGESPDLLPVLEEGEDSAVLTLARELTTRLPEAAIKATLATPRLMHDELKKMETKVTPDPAGHGIIRLPSDYLSFYSLKLKDWKEELTAIEPPDTLRRALGSNAPPWMICSERPMAIEERDSEGLFLKIYGSDAFDLGATLFYAPRPEFDGEILTISQAAYYLMLYELSGASNSIPK